MRDEHERCNVNHEALEQIQTKIAFLEQANADLSDVVFRQQLEIRALGARIKEVSERLAAAMSEDGQRSAADERPPHY
jgi:SlyX protein